MITLFGSLIETKRVLQEEMKRFGREAGERQCRCLLRDRKEGMDPDSNMRISALHKTKKHGDPKFGPSRY